MISDILVKIFDLNINLIGKGYLLSHSSEIIMVKGTNLPILVSGKEIIIEIYNELTGISQYFCKVNVASDNQLNALIRRTMPSFERRNSLKVRTDLSFYLESLHRNGENIIKNYPNMRINILNLSIGGMLISSNYELLVKDVIIFSFHYEKSLVISLKAKIIRIDRIYDSTKQTPVKNYGCKFKQMPSYYEDIITKYLYIRQLQLYRDTEK